MPNEDNIVTFTINKFYQIQNINKVIWQVYDRKKWHQLQSVSQFI